MCGFILLSIVNFMIQLLFHLPIDTNPVLFKWMGKKKDIKKEGKQSNKKIKVERGKEIELSSFFVFHATELQFHPSLVCFCLSHP